ncbi:hypothetical protein NA57DRAFT_81420 [Rhizodiscina lignyota]|uniref:Retinoic acid induced 16-like protein n=1 Tax=Rhizodiscina lignyota TaxID=1504668 RepID=A0A9P4M0C8_9PEZI|nr:hypothetical protein NA57DRAFT_81420 [Rhizodiscina lignyota]
MDFFSRLIGGGNKPSSASNNPKQRLARFQQIYDRLLHTVQKSQALHNDPQALESIRVSFQRLTTILHDESRSPAPHLSLSFAASAQIYITIARIASACYNESVIREAVAFFGALIDSEEEEFLAAERFAQSLMGFVDRISSGGGGGIFVGEDTEVEVVELLFGITAKIRLQPEILPVWFRQRNVISESEFLEKDRERRRQGFAGVTQKEDFPLCYQLIDHVHHGGRIGDFARTGLLYVFESASKSDELEQWLVESDIPTLMATGLGALYSQLSRKLSIVHPKEDMPIVLVLSDYAEGPPAGDAESLFSPNLKTHMDTFLSYLTFWQDVLEHCKSIDVRQTLLDHFQVLFLQQLLYPSLLESSDADGGSSVAVLMYLRRILEALDHPELIHMMLQYLLAMPEGMNGLPQESSASPRLVRRRRSLMLLASNPKDDEQLNPSLFSLVDLILSSLRSNNQQTVTAAFRLVSIILSKNHTYGIGSLVKVSFSSNKEIHRTHGSLNAEMDAYLDLAKTIGDTGLDEAYESHLKDALKLLESHTCSAQILKLDELGFAPKQADSSLICLREPTTHHLSPDDSMFRYTLEVLETFLTNNVEVNLGLTETVITLASCGHLLLEGWLSVEPSKYVYHDTDSNLESSIQSLSQSMTATNGALPTEADHITALELARRRPNWYRRNTPSLLAALHAIHAELSSVRAAVPDFDVLLTARRQAFSLYDAISEAIANAPPPVPPKDFAQASPPRSQAGTPAPKDGKRSIADRIFAEYERSISGSGSPSKPIPGVGKTLNLAQRMLADYERSIGGDASVGSRDSPRPPRTPRSNSKSKVPPSGSPGSSTPQQQQGLGSYGLLGSRSPATPQARSRAQSPRPGESMNAAVRDPRALLNDVVREADAEILKRRFQFGSKDNQKVADGEKQFATGAEAGPDADTEGAKSEEKKTDKALREASLSHILTNAVILQEFELELVALMQVRASMFGEVRFA